MIPLSKLFALASDPAKAVELVIAGMPGLTRTVALNRVAQVLAKIAADLALVSSQQMTVALLQKRDVTEEEVNTTVPMMKALLNDAFVLQWLLDHTEPLNLDDLLNAFSIKRLDKNPLEIAEGELPPQPPPANGNGAAA